MKILIVLTSHSKLGSTDRTTGVWLEELASPYYLFQQAGHQMTLASPLGGLVPIDPASETVDFQTVASRRFADDSEAQRILASTISLQQINADEFDALFFPGGHGPLWDLVDNNASIQIIESLYRAGKPVASVCHGVVALLNANDSDNKSLVKEKRVTGFSNSEEAAVGLTEVVPFLVEDELKAKGGIFYQGDDWNSYVEVEDNLITGQNPASSEAVALELLKQLNL